MYQACMEMGKWLPFGLDDTMSLLLYSNRIVYQCRFLLCTRQAYKDFKFMLNYLTNFYEKLMFHTKMELLINAFLLSVAGLMFMYMVEKSYFSLLYRVVVQSL